MKKLISMLMAISLIISCAMSAGFCSSAEMIDGEEGIDYVEALYFENAPHIDGYISEAEWGEATIELYSDWCATMDDSQPYYNSFFFWRTGPAEDHPMEAKIWLRWDEDYYYVGVKVKDFDGHSLAHNKSNAWNGDAIQFRVDCEGANSATGGDVYDPSLGTPWMEPDVTPDFLVGYTEIAGGYFECYEATNNVGLTYNDYPVFGEAQLAVSPSETHSDSPINYHDDSMAGYTTYEVAIPWKYIFENHLVPDYFWLPEEECEPYILEYSEYDFRRNPDGGIGYSLGMSLTVFNAGADSNQWKSFMSWGSGTTTVQNDYAHQTCAGSNSVTLSGEKVAGGNYKMYDPSVLEAEDTYSAYDSVFYDYLSGDVDKLEPIENYDDLWTLTYDDPSHMEFWGSKDLYQGSLAYTDKEHGLSLNYDRMLETKIDEWGVYRFEGVDAIDQFYIDTSLTANGSARLTYPLSYTFEFDIKYTGNEIVQADKPSRLGIWFGGSGGYSYYCGYSFELEAFVISESMGDEEILYLGFADFEQDVWSNWKFQYDNDTYTVRFYVDDQLVFNISDRNFYYSDKKMQDDGTMLIMWFLNTQMKMDNVKVYNFYDYVKNPVGGTHTISGKVNSFGEEDVLTAHLIDIYTAEVLQSVELYGNSAEYKFENVANGDYIVYIEKNKHMGGYTLAFVEGESIEIEEVTLYLIGDADCDGSVTGTDITTVILAMKNEEYYSELCDVDGDYSITASDIMAVISIMKGKYQYPSYDWVE